MCIPAWDSNYIYHKVWNEIIYPFPNFNIQLLKFGNGKVISSYILLSMYLFIHAGIKVDSC